MDDIWDVKGKKISMKTGVVTYFDIANYGSVLQAFAMRQTLKKLGSECVFIRIKETRPLHKYLHKLHVACVTGTKYLFNKSARSTHREIHSLKKQSITGVSEESNAAFREFIDKNLPSLAIGRLALKKTAAGEEFFAFICGSDQIWSPLSLHISSYKYLEFAPEWKRIAYAPSFGVEDIPSYNRSYVKKALLRIDQLSVREHNGADIIRRLTGRDAPVLLDPTMLLTGEEWRELYKESRPCRPNSPYALCYFFDEPEDETIEQITAFTESHDLKLVVLMTNNTKLLQKGAKYIIANPWQFLELVDNAEYVFTNSFHGGVFSVLFDKHFTIFGRKHSQTVKQTSRIDSLLTTVGAEDCFYTNNREFYFTEEICYSEKLTKQREKSLDYLGNALKKVQKPERIEGKV